MSFQKSLGTAYYFCLLREALSLSPHCICSRQRTTASPPHALWCVSSYLICCHFSHLLKYRCWAATRHSSSRTAKENLTPRFAGFCPTFCWTRRQQCDNQNLSEPCDLRITIHWISTHPGNSSHGDLILYLYSCMSKCRKLLFISFDMHVPPMVFLRSFIMVSWHVWGHLVTSSIWGFTGVVCVSWFKRWKNRKCNSSNARGLHSTVNSSNNITILIVDDVAIWSEPRCLCLLLLRYKCRFFRVCSQKHFMIFKWSDN